MLKRIKLIQGVGNYTQTRASGIELSDVTVVYGENRYGKSTFCDVMHSLAEDNPSFILNRQSIPNDLTKPPKVELMFGTAVGNVTSKFENAEWQVKIPACSKLYVFDQSFIHRNVITGQKQERPNSESMTSFILGENNTALFADLAGLNDRLREERRLLSNLQGQFTPHTVGDIPEYVSSALPEDTKEQLESSAAAHEVSMQQITTTIQNIDKIKRRSLLTWVGTQVNFTQVCDSINSVLASSLQNVHHESLLSLQQHMTNHVTNSVTFKGWVSQGISQIKDDCPFCGQTLDADAQSLIVAYQQAFNEEFDRFNDTTRQTLNRLRQPFNIANTRDQLIQQHHANMQVFELYIEPEIISNQTLEPLKITLTQKHEAILASFDSVVVKSQSATEFWIPRLEQKFATPYEPAEPVSFDILNTAAKAYSQAICDYWVVADQINAIFTAYKDSLNEVQLNTQLTAIRQEQTQDSLKLKRIELEPLCLQYREKLATVNELDASYREQKKQLEESQTAYLEAYFNSINELFRQLGSSNFEIIKAHNNRGKQVIYDLRVKFKGEDIPADRINTVFSESDRRALALCIFLAKVLTLSEEEKAKAILILDDPVTSFDNERIELILIKLDELQRTVKQLVVTTHYKGMAAKTAKKFRHCAKALKLVHGGDTCSINEVDIADMIASDHDIAFDNIKAFVDRETHFDIRTSLRPFLETEIRSRFKKQLVELGKTPLSDLSPCIGALKSNGNISPDVEARLSSIINSLNTPMHEIGGDPLENTRSLAEQILNIVYGDL
ncbi:AAA family ATPase [Nitrincola sp.]|uniref:AAA family ATPase n=1 Tax=Nitrincola sp. TaxID=1926584 RepID=UPI003A8F6A53